MACGAHPWIWIVGLGLVDDLVACPAEVAADRVGEVTDCVRPVEDELITLVLGDTHVCRRHRAAGHTIDARNDSEGGEDVVTLLVEVVEIYREAVAEELGLDTDVILARSLPSDVRITEHTFCSTIEVWVLVRTVTATYIISCLIEVVSIRKIIVSSRSSETVVTDFTVRSADLHEREDVVLREPFLLGRDPTCRDCREEAEALAFCELLGSIVTGIHLEHVAVIIVICNTAYKSHDAGRDMV